MQNVKLIQAKYKEYKRLSDITDALDERASMFIEGDDIECCEKEWDEAYVDEFEAYMDLVHTLQGELGIDFESAKEMIHTAEFEHLMSLRIVD